MIVEIPEWIGPEKQFINDGSVEYDIASVIFEARELAVFEIPLIGLRIDYSISSGCLLDFVSHMNAVLDADLSKPIILDNEGWVLDGRHRIARALHEGKETILAVRFEENPFSRELKKNAG
jgi:hypothetical protein